VDAHHIQGMADLPEPLRLETRAVIVFDDVCRLCEGTVRFIVPRDREGRFAFLPAQSALGRAALVSAGLDPTAPESFLLIEDGAVYQKSDAALQIAARLPGLWPLLGLVGERLPLQLRDWVYDLIARNRYTWFGKRTQCLAPSAALQRRFLA
jgi:predicted DCC family thiol-disulfide oxidoreductase YuxK